MGNYYKKNYHTLSSFHENELGFGRLVLFILVLI